VFLAVIGALAIGLSLGLLGSGGSILTVPVLHYLVGQPEKLAIGGSLMVVGLIAAAACIPYAVGRQVDWRSVAWFGVPGMAGAWLGASLAHWVPGPVQLALFAAVMLISAWRMLSGGLAGATREEPRRLAVLAGGTGVGVLSGLVGVGGGFLIVPALVLLAGVPMVDAVGTSLAIIALNAFTGFAKYSTGRFSPASPSSASWAASSGTGWAVACRRRRCAGCSACSSSRWGSSSRSTSDRGCSAQSAASQDAPNPGGARRCPPSRA